MVRFLSAGTVHDGAPPKLATTTALPSGQGTLPLCPTSPTSRSAPHRSAQFPQPLTASAPRQRSPPVAATRLHTKSLLPPRRPHRCSRGDSATKPIKEPTLSCGLAHCTVSSLSRRSPQPPFSALARRETNETFFIHTLTRENVRFFFKQLCNMREVRCACVGYREDEGTAGHPCVAVFPPRSSDREFIKKRDS